MRDFWQDEASCLGMDNKIFYPDVVEERGNDHTEDFAEAKSICASCPVRVECLQESIKMREPDGVWGGLTPRERRRAIRKANAGTRTPVKLNADPQS